MKFNSVHPRSSSKTKNLSFCLAGCSATRFFSLQPYDCLKAKISDLLPQSATSFCKYTVVKSLVFVLFSCMSSREKSREFCLKSFAATLTKPGGNFRDPSANLGQNKYPQLPMDVTGGSRGSKHMTHADPRKISL